MGSDHGFLLEDSAIATPIQDNQNSVFPNWGSPNTLVNRFLACSGINFADPRDRTFLLVKIRWFLLGLLATSCLAAGFLFLRSPYGFFLSRSQLVALFLSVAVILLHNGAVHLFYDRLARPIYVNSLQVLLDLSIVTFLVHFSGGAASWFWPVYLLVTLEAAVLLEQPHRVWLMGLSGALLYGLVLLGGHQGWWANVSMPFVVKNLHQNGLHLFLLWFWVSVLNAAVAVAGVFLMSVIRRENQELRNSQKGMSEFLETASDLIFNVDKDGRLRFANRAWRRAMGYDGNDLQKLNLKDIVHPEFRENCSHEFNRVLRGEAGRVTNGRLLNRHDEVLEVEGSLTRCCLHNDGLGTVWAICRDVTEHKKAQAQLYRLAHYDQLTGLPNRAFFLDRLNHSIALARRQGRQVAVLFLDLDRFKIINDTLGHVLGDRLLREMGQRLCECIREVDAVARMGGDEFTLCLGDVNGAESVEKVAKKILKNLVRPLCIDGHELFITTSIGISLFPDHHQDAQSLIKKADIAMYHAKAQGRNNYQFYREEMDSDVEKRLVLETAIRKALEMGQFRIFYQPKVDIATGRITAMEALLRWDHPELGLLPPNEFIPLAEETGLIFSIGEWVLLQACLQNRQWQQRGLPRMRVAVNISGYQLQQREFIDIVRRVLDESGLASCDLEIEVTETVVMQNPESAVAILNQLRDLGVMIAIDDFGTGYSSLAHLKRFSVNTLKIDKSFVRDVELDATDAAIATAIISMGNSLKLQVIAEGVETEGQLDFLRDHRCQEMQGYLFSKPLPAEEIEHFLLQVDRNGPDPRFHECEQ